MGHWVSTAMNEGAKNVELAMTAKNLKMAAGVIGVGAGLSSLDNSDQLNRGALSTAAHLAVGAGVAAGATYHGGMAIKKAMLNNIKTIV